MRKPLLFLSLLLALAGCSSEAATGSTADSPDTEVRVGAKKSISGLRLGKYVDTLAEEGQFTELSLESRTSRTPREYDGVWSAKIKQGSSTKTVKGGFTIVRRRIPMSSNVNGFITTNVIKLFDVTKALFMQRSYVNVQNSTAFYDWTTESEQIMDLAVDAAGNKPFELDCTLSTLHDDNVFEEGLSADEYPDIGIVEVGGKLEVGIGAASFDGSDGERIVVKSRSGSDIDLTIDMGDGYTYRVAVTAKKGVIEHTENGATSKVADFTCR